MDKEFDIDLFNGEVDGHGPLWRWSFCHPTSEGASFRHLLTNDKGLFSKIENVRHPIDILERGIIAHRQIDAKHQRV